MCKRTGCITVKNTSTKTVFCTFVYIFININISILTIIYTSNFILRSIFYLLTLGLVPSPFSLSPLHHVCPSNVLSLPLASLSLYEYHDLNLIKHHNYLYQKGQFANSLCSLTWPRRFIPTPLHRLLIYIFSIIIYLLFAPFIKILICSTRFYRDSVQ